LPAREKGQLEAAAPGAVQDGSLKASEVLGKVRGSRSKVAGTSRGEASEGSSKARESRSKTGAARASASGSEMARELRAEATETSSMPQGGSKEALMLESDPDSSPRINNSKAVPQIERRFSVENLRDLPPVTATPPPQSDMRLDGTNSAPLQTLAPLQALAESPGPMAPVAAQTPTPAKLRPRSASGPRKPASVLGAIHNTPQPQATKTVSRTESATDLRPLPQGRGLEAVRARRQAF
jgi:hypothetical protein